MAQPPRVSLNPDDPFIGIRLLSVMAWPKSLNTRELSLTGIAVSMLAEMEADCGKRAETFAKQAVKEAAENLGLSFEAVASLPEWQSELAAMKKWLEDDMASSLHSEIIEPAGGWRALNDKPGFTALKRALVEAGREGGLAGETLLLVERMRMFSPDIQPSLNRVHFMLNSYRNSNVPSERTLKKYWVEWRCVAPLLAAHRVMCKQLVARGLDIQTNADLFDKPEICRAIVSWAKWFRIQGTCFKADKARDAFLPEVEAIEYDCPWIPRQPPLWPLSDTEIKAAAAYVMTHL